MGVTVATVGTDEFPGFFTSKSGVKCGFGRVENAKEAAALWTTCRALRPRTGLLLAQPIPDHKHADTDAGHVVAEAVEAALDEASKRGLTGAAVTPFLLERVRQLTGDASLEANVRLVLNNARFAADMACELAAHEANGGKHSSTTGT